MDDKSHSKIELIIQLALILVGITCGIVFYFYRVPSLSAVMFSIAISSILYRFLGGIGQDSSFRMGAVKLGGSAAVLLAFMYIISTVVFKEVTENMSFSPVEGWIPIDPATGKVVTLKVKNGSEEIKTIPGSNINYGDQRKTIELKIVPRSGGFYVVQSKTRDTIGYSNQNDIHFGDLDRIEPNPQKSASSNERYKSVGIWLDTDQGRQSSKGSRIPEVRKLPFEIIYQSGCSWLAIDANKKDTLISEQSCASGEVYQIDVSSDPKIKYLIHCISVNCSNVEIPRLVGFSVVPYRIADKP